MANEEVKQIAFPNISTFDAMSAPPKTALKQINGGRLKGMTDINPQWRFRAMTQVYGLCGFGWKYTIEELWKEDGVAGEVMCFAKIALYVFAPTVGWSDPIFGVGGSALISKESTGLRASDEGYKMAITDGLSVAMKQIGIASAIYEGRWDGSKYRHIEDDPNGCTLANPSSRVQYEEEQIDASIEAGDRKQKSLAEVRQWCDGLKAPLKACKTKEDFSKHKQDAIDYFGELPEMVKTTLDTAFKVWSKGQLSTEGK